ncbi:MAG: glycerophosphodiester phosphodiesterase family protein [Candidatus Thorarchaeota archaeon]
MKRQIVVGHRGASGLAPENTMLAHRAAYDAGAHMVEIDVQETLDGKLVCIHDYNVDRTTNGSGAVAELSYREIQELDAGNGAKIPTLTEVLDYVRGKMKINIELKVTDIEKDVLSMVNERSMNSNVVVSSFLHGTLVATRNLDSDIYTAVLDETLRDDLISNVLELKANALNLDHTLLTPDILEQAHGENIEVFAWTVNDSSKMKDFYKMGVDGIITDYPDIAIEILNKQ